MDIHVVKPGDTLYSIALSHGVPMSRLLEDNQLPDPSPAGGGTDHRDPVPGAHLCGPLRRYALLHRSGQRPDCQDPAPQQPLSGGGRTASFQGRSWSSPTARRNRGPSPSTDTPTPTSTAPCSSAPSPISAACSLLLRGHRPGGAHPAGRRGPGGCGQTDGGGPHHEHHQPDTGRHVLAGTGPYHPLRSRHPGETGRQRDGGHPCPQLSGAGRGL